MVGTTAGDDVRTLMLVIATIADSELVGTGTGFMELVGNEE